MSNPTHTSTRTRRRRTALAMAAPAVAIGLLALAGCGSNSSASTASNGSNMSGSTGMTVSVSDTSAGDVLTTSDGKTLYFSDQEKKKVLCDSGACQAIWTPLTVSSGDQPTGPTKVAPELSTLERSDGSEQVALDGRPLYTFSFDHSTGDVNGDGQRDSFDGIDFTWHAATPTGKTPAAPSGGSTTQSPYDNGSNTGGNGGYNY